MYPYPEKRILENEHIILTPMDISDTNSLYRVIEQNDDNLFYHMFFGPFKSEEDVRLYIESQLQNTANVVFTVLSKRSQEVVGSVSLININNKTGEAEIGSIWYSLKVQHTEVNTAVALCLLKYLFDDLHYRRVVWKCDDINISSKKSAEALGFVYEGLFRKHMIIKGRNRDTAWYSMIDDEWAGKKSGLQQRLKIKLMKTH
ncbi:GNAT family N-acetyltransferase [Spirochaeta cellobiosiphila]|uniref:GNAT family N-acetyltransferase n=1 Tax=Spirochaeta cellobiosiphila TaxID=504483 RepID=UPI000413CA2D|nr:GNAT family protein [Spirochaeta cellobiosiphila]